MKSHHTRTRRGAAILGMVIFSILLTGFTFLTAYLDSVPTYDGKTVGEWFWVEIRNPG